ncbi:MAG: hypothetical protein PHS31_01175 [Victivallaceae bacterium]|nr:hypothetical protein [Victivallaceae bacterium]
MSTDRTKETTRIVVATLQAAVNAELERKAKLGYKAVVADKNGNPKVVSAKYLLRKLKAAGKR